MLQNASHMFFSQKKKKQNKTKLLRKKENNSHPGVEPKTVDVEGERIIHCATQPLLRP